MSLRPVWAQHGTPAGGRSLDIGVSAHARRSGPVTSGGLGRGGVRAWNGRHPGFILLFFYSGNTCYRILAHCSRIWISCPYHGLYHGSKHEPFLKNLNSTRGVAGEVTHIRTTSEQPQNNRACPTVTQRRLAVAANTTAAAVQPNLPWTNHPFGSVLRAYPPLVGPSTPGLPFSGQCTQLHTFHPQACQTFP